MAVSGYDLDARAVARSRSGPGDTARRGTGINNVSIVLLGQVADRRFLLMGDVEEEHRPVTAQGRPAARRSAQGRPPRQQDRDDAAFVDATRPPSRSPRPGPAIRRAPGEVDTRSADGIGGARLSDGPRRNGRGRVRGERDDRACGRWPTGGCGADAIGIGQDPDHPPERVPVCGPRHRAAAGSGGAGSSPRVAPRPEPDRRVPSSR